MTRGQLPKAFLRVDPDIDQKHPDNLDGFIRLLCAANRQVPRGRFSSRAVMDRLFGKAAVDKFAKRKDIRTEPDGSITVPGWHVWQEGDWTVAERMRRYRDSKGGISGEEASLGPSPTVTTGVTDTVTDTVTVASPASEASRRLGVKASIDEPPPSLRSGGSAPPSRPPSPAQRVKAWLRDHEVAQPVGWEASKVNELSRQFGADAVIAAFEEARQTGSAVTCRNFVRWAEQSLSPDVAPRNGSAPKGHTRTAKEAIDAFRR